MWGIAWGPSFWAQQSVIHEQHWLVTGTPLHTWETWVRVLNLPVRMLFNVQSVQGNLNVAHSLIGLILVAGCLWILRRYRARESFVFILWYLVPLALFSAADLMTGRETLAHLRFPYVCLPGLVGMLVLSIHHLSRRWAPAALGGLCVLGMVLLHFYFPLERKPQGRAAGQAIRAGVSAKDLLVFDGIDMPDLFSDSSLYLQCLHYAGEFNGPVLLLNKKPDELLRSAMRAYHRIVVCYGRSLPPDELDLSDYQLVSPPYPRFPGIGCLYTYVKNPAATSSAPLQSGESTADRVTPDPRALHSISTAR